MAQTQPQLQPEPRDRSLRIAQASGMVAAQMTCSMPTAILLLERRAELIGCAVGVLATAVIERRVRFGEPAPM